MTSSRIFRPVSGPNPARKNSAKNAPVLCQVRHAPGHSLFSFCVKKGLQNGPYSQLHFCTQNASLASPIPAYRLHIADIPPTRSSPTAILIYPAPLYARTFPCSGRGSCSLRTPRPRELAGASFFLELQDAIERVWEEWTPTADVRGMMHFGDRSQPLSVLPGQRANSARPDPRRECPSGTAAWRTSAIPCLLPTA